MKLFFFLCTLFQTRLEIGSSILDVEVAKTAETRAKGLMEREALAENEGMLFVYQKPEKLGFWMKNTRIPLSIGFFDKERRLIEVLDMHVQLTDPLIIYESSKPALYALEVNQGWFQKNKIRLGSQFSFPRSQNPLE